MRLLAATCSCLLLALAAPAHAIDVYAGATAGQDLDGRFDDAPGEVDADSTWKVYGGLAFAPGWSLELAYHDFGDASCCGGGISDFGFDADTDGFSAGIVYRLDLERWHPFAKLGYFGADTEGELVTVAGPRDFDESENGAMGELGATFDVSDRFALRAGYEWFDFDGGSDGAFNAGAEVRF